MSNIKVMDDLEWKHLDKIAQRASQVPSFVYFKKPFEAWLAIKAGQELGLSEISSLNNIFVVNGRTAMGGQLMLQKIYEANGSLQFNLTDEACIIKAKRDGDEGWTEFRFSMDDARRAGLLGKDNWKKYPRQMLKWRCVADMARTIFPDAIGPAPHIPDELGLDDEREVSTFKRPEDNKSDLTDVFNISDKDNTGGAASTPTSPVDGDAGASHETTP